MKKPLLALLFGATLLASCDPDNNNNPVPTTSSVYILSEGRFQAGDGAVSAFDKTTKALSADAYAAANGGSMLGDVVQDMGVVGSRGYICVNASNKVVVVSLPDFKAVKTIANIRQPRYFASTSATRGYVTSWRGPYTNYAPGKVMVLDLTTNTVIDSITVGRCPEQLTVLNNMLYVPNSYDNTVSVIDAGTNRVTSTVTVGDGPRNVVADQANNIWALCSGFTVYNSAAPYNVISSTPASLVRFAPGSTAAQLTLPFTSGSPKQLRISPDKSQLYYAYNGAEYRMATTATALPTAIFMRRNFNGFAIDPSDNSIYGAVSTGYTTNGYFLHYPAGGGKVIDSLAVKVGPNGFAFY
ncbi:YncE family protein [Hymenobacter bucti]|uniref:YncE family protein n=1 Tax=Hymenobacter bucti TaxID=1844114 RepID=A0ABW4QPF0_9BACT